MLCYVRLGFDDAYPHTLRSVLHRCRNVIHQSAVTVTASWWITLRRESSNVTIAIVTASWWLTLRRVTAKRFYVALTLFYKPRRLDLSSSLIVRSRVVSGTRAQRWDLANWLSGPAASEGAVYP